MRLGSYPLTVGFLVSLAALVLFALVAYGLRLDAGLVPLDVVVTDTLEANSREHPEIRKAFGMLTHLGGPEVLLPGALLVTLALVARRQNLLAFAWMVVLVGAAVLNEALKLAFQRQRPTLALQTWSFPSGHSMNSFVFYGLLAYLLFLRLRGVRQRVIVVSGLGLLVLAIGFSRIYLGVHWLTDVLGGFIVAAAWLALWIGTIETARRRSVPAQRNV